MATAAVPVNTGSRRCRAAEVAGFHVARLEFPPELRLGLHTHERPTVAVILRGAFEGIAPGNSRPCPSGTALVEPAGRSHGNRFDRAGAEVLVIQPDPTRLELLEPFRDLLDRPGFQRDLSTAVLARRAAGELVAHDAVAPFALEGLVLELLAACVRARQASARRPPRWLAQARDLLNDRWNEPLRVSDVAAAVGVHPVHLARQFRMQYGLGIGAYLRALRLEWAARELANTDDRITNIALRAGFFDQSHFTRTFRRQVGMTPLEYRRTLSSSPHRIQDEEASAGLVKRATDGPSVGVET